MTPQSFREQAQLVLSYALSGEPDILPATTAAAVVLGHKDDPNLRAQYGSWLFDELAPEVLRYARELGRQAHHDARLSDVAALCQSLSLDGQRCHECGGPSSSGTRCAYCEEAAIA